MRRLEIISPRLLVGGDIYYAGDEADFDNDEAQTLIDAGWARCSITGETGERVVTRVSLKVHNSQIDMKAK